MKCATFSSIVLVLVLGLSAAAMRSPGGDAASTATAPTTRAILATQWTRAESLDREGLVIATVVRPISDLIWIATQGRTDEPTANESEAATFEYADETLNALRELGVNMLVFPYGGNGVGERELADRQHARTLAEAARKHGFWIGIWLPGATINVGRWAAASRPADELLVRDRQGHPLQTLSRGWFFASRMTKAYRENSAALLDEALATIQPDAVFLPDFGIAAGFEPESVAGFREYVAARMEDPTIRGTVTSLDQLQPPAADDVTSPLAELWHEYRSGVLVAEAARVRKALTDRGRAVSFGIEASLTPIRPTNDAGATLNMPDLVPHVNFVWDSVTIRIDSSFRIHHQIPLLKALADAGCRPIVTCQQPLDAVQSMIFAQNVFGSGGFFPNGTFSSDAFGWQPVKRVTMDLAAFFRARREFYAGVQRIVDVVLWRPSVVDAGQSMAEATLYTQTESALITHRVPFTVDIDPGLRLLRPDRILVLAGASRLSDAQMQRIEQHVRSGGGLVLIGDAGTRDGRGRPRAESLSRRLQPTDPAATRPAQDGVRRWTLDAGRVAMLRQPGPPINIWLRAKQTSVRSPRAVSVYKDEFYTTLKWALGREFAFDAPLHDAGVVEITRSESGRFILIHEMNFHATRPEGAIQMRVSLPAGRKVLSVRRFSPAENKEADVAFQAAGDAVTFTAGPCSLYELYAIELQ